MANLLSLAYFSVSTSFDTFIYSFGYICCCSKDNNGIFSNFQSQVLSSFPYLFIQSTFPRLSHMLYFLEVTCLFVLPALKFVSYANLVEIVVDVQPKFSSEVWLTNKLFKWFCLLGISSSSVFPGC